MSVPVRRFPLPPAQTPPLALRPGPARCSPCGACPVREISVCGALDPHELERLAAIATQLQVPPGKSIVNEGDAAAEMFNITGGWVKLYKLLADGRRQITGFLFTGDFLGFGATLNYGWTAEAMTAVSLCRFPRQALERALDELPALRERLFNMASNEIAAAHEQMLLLGRKTAREKLASFLIQMQKNGVRAGERGKVIALPMSRSDMADYLGLTTETVSRTITQLKRDKVIALADSGHVQVLAPGGLAAIAEGETSK